MDKNIAAAIVNLQDAIRNLESAKANIKAATFDCQDRGTQMANLDYRDASADGVDHLIYYASQAISDLEKMN